MKMTAQELRDLSTHMRGDGGVFETFSFRMVEARIEGLPPYEDQQLDMDPDYQRGYVWTDRQAALFLGHMIEGGHVGPLTVNRDESGARRDEIVDGKQRLLSAYRWLKGEIAAELYDGRRLRFEDLDEQAQGLVKSMSGCYFQVKYVYLDRAGVLDLYLRHNRGGSIHTDAEIERVRALLERARKSS